VVGSSGRRIVVEFIGDASSLKSNAAQGEKALTGFSGKAQAAGNIAGKALAGGLLLAGAAAVSATKAAAEDEAAQSQLATQLRNTTGATDSQIATVEKYISSLSLATGVSDDELRPSLAKLATATGDVGQAINLQRIAMDVAAGTGKSLAQVTDAMVKAQNGSVGGLGRLGVATKNAAGETKSFAEIQNDLATKYQGAAARAADTTAGKTKIMTVQFGELQEQIGAKLLPVMVKLSEEGLKAVNWISQNTTTVGVLVGALGALLAITWAVGVATKAFAAIQAVIRAATVAWTAVQWLLNVALDANPIGLVIIAIAALVAGIILAWKHSETFRAIVLAVWDAIKAAAAALWGGIKSAFDSIINKWNEAKAIAAAVKDFIVGRFQAIVDWVGGLPGMIKGALSTLTNDVRDIFDNAMTAGKNKVENIGGTIVGWITGIPGKLLEKVGDFRSAGESLIGAVVNGMKNAAGVIEGIASNVWDAVKSLLNGAIDRINAALSFTISLPGPDISVNPPDIPHLAKGGVVRKPTLALIGEDGPEAVVPLGKKNAPRGSMPGMGGGGTTVQIFVQSLDPRGAGKAVVDALREYERQTGRQYVVSPA
jgi:hypothetical protein